MQNQDSRVWRALFFAWPIFLCVACGTFGGGDRVGTRLEGVSVLTSADANHATATALDIVLVYDAAMAPLLPTNAEAWFTQRSELAAHFGASMDVVSVQLPPAFLLPEVRLPTRVAKARRVVAYANHLAAPGRVPIDLTAFAKVQLTLARETFSAVEIVTP